MIYYPFDEIRGWARKASWQVSYPTPRWRRRIHLQELSLASKYDTVLHDNAQRLDFDMRKDMRKLRGFRAKR